MLAKLSTLLVLATALLLVLPPGWCCIAPAQAALPEAPGCPACASKSSPEKHAPRQSAPHGAKHCCCSIAATKSTPEAKVLGPTLWAVAPALLDLPLVLEPRRDAAVSFLPDPGPPLRVLQCVLRL